MKLGVNVIFLILFYIIDELDKLDPSNNTNILDKEYSVSSRR